MKNENLPRGRQTFGLRTGKRETTTIRGRTPIDTYPPTVETPIVSNRIITDTPVREKELAPAPTKQEAQAANQGAYAGETRTVERVGRNRVLKTVLPGGLVLAGGAFAYGTVPAVHQAVDSAFLDHIKGKSLSSDSSINPEVFDNKAKKGSITKTNTILAGSLDEIKDIPQASDDKHSINILIPIEGLPQSGEIKYSRDLTGKSAFNPVYAPEARQYALEHDIKNNLYLKNIPAGSTIISPVDGEFMYNRISDNELPEGTIDGATFFFKDENGIVYQINISGGSAQPLSPVKNIEPRRIKDDYKNFLHPIEKGEPILRLLEQGDIFIFAHAWPSEESGREGTTPGNAKKVYPTNINLITLPDPSTGEDKIVLANRQNVNLP